MNFELLASDGAARRHRHVGEVDRVHLFARINGEIVRAVHLEHPHRALVERAEDAVIDEHIGARGLHIKLNDGRAACGDERRLYVLLKPCAALVEDLVEDLADDVEARRHVGTTDAEVQADTLADLGLERVVADQGSLRAVEHDVGRVLVDALLHVERLQALLVVLADGVEVALHHVVLAVDLRQRLLRLHVDEPVHAVGDVHADRRGGAVVDVQAGVERLEAETADVAGRGETGGGATAGPGHPVQVDVVRHLAVRHVAQVELHRVALAHADEAARHGGAKGQWK